MSVFVSGRAIVME